MEHDKAHPVFTVTIERCPLPPTPIELKVTTPSLDLPRLASGRFGRTDVVHAVVPENRFRDEPGRYAVFQGIFRSGLRTRRRERCWTCSST